MISSLITNRLSFLRQNILTPISPLSAPNLANYVSFSTNAFGATSSITNLSNATALACKMKMRVDWLRNIGASTSACLWQVSSTTIGTNIKMEFWASTDASQNISFHVQCPTLGSLITTTPIVPSTFPANSNDIVLYADWTSATARQYQIYTPTGTSVTGQTDAQNLGLLPVVAGNGAIFLNTCQTASLVISNLIDGIAWYSAGLAVGSQWTKPAVGDAGLLAGYLLNDGISGGSLVGGGPSLVFTGTVTSVPGGSW